MGFGRNLLMSIFPYAIPESNMTDDEVIRQTRNYIPQDTNVPIEVLRDALRGVEMASHNNADESFNDLLEKAMNTRLAYSNVPERGVAYSPTKADMFDLWNPNIVVPARTGSRGIDTLSEALQSGFVPTTGVRGLDTESELRRIYGR